MDRRKLQRIGLCAGILAVTLALGFFLLHLTWGIVYREDARKLGTLAAEFPENEAAITAVFNGKTIDSSHDSSSSSSDALSEGLRLFDKYVYTLNDSIRSGPIGTYALAGAFLVTGAAAASILFLIRSAAESKASRIQIERLEEELQNSRRRFELTEHTLRQEEQNTKSLVTDISHQLKTPLASLKMSYELADSSDLTYEEQKEFAQKEREEVAKLEALLSVFTQLTRLETGMIEPHPENTSLKGTLSRAVSSVYMKAFEKGIDLSVEEFSDVLIPHDSRWTAEVFLNVLDNAVKYSPSGSAVVIRVTELASYMMIEVTDQGIGVPASETQNIFKRFYRGSAPEVKHAEGSGVGLYLARRVLEQQGGTICVKPNPGGGSCFVLTLPKQNATSLPRPEQNALAEEL